jgi:hypothetical protein
MSSSKSDLCRPAVVKRTGRLLLAICLFFCATPANAEEGAEHHGETAHAFHANVIGLFVGRTSETRRHGEFTLGLEYNRRFSEHFGMGALYEHVFADDEFKIGAISFAYYNGPWKMYVAPGIEKSKEHDAEFLFRVGAEYAFRIGRGFELSPQADIDFVDGDVVLVFGLTLGKGF